MVQNPLNPKHNDHGLLKEGDSTFISSTQRQGRENLNLILKETLMYLNDKRVVPNHVLNKTQRTSFYEKKKQKKQREFLEFPLRKGLLIS